MDIKYIENLILSLKNDYISEIKGEKPSKRWLQDFNEEIREIKSYRGREILELLQNADDAQSDQVEITLNKECHILKIVNRGSRTLPFTKEGVESIMFANLSPKKNSNLIGAKGLGFRSILNWTNSVEIISDNVQINFNSEIVHRFWMNCMRPHLKNAFDIEHNATKENREVPLAILTLPEIKEIKKVDSTTISIKYLPEREESIIQDLKEFRPKSLLFLHNITSISIEIIGDNTIKYENEFKFEEDGIVGSKLMGEEWVVAKNCGSIKIGNRNRNYEIACAFCLTNKELNDEPIYDFFPTLEKFGLPCIIHATLELDSSRNSLIQDSTNNYVVINQLPKVIKRIAEYLKTQRYSWDAYALMRPIISSGKTNYISELYALLNNIDGEYIPTLGKKYVNPKECYYYTDSLFEIIQQSEHGKDCFPKMRLKTPRNSNITVSDNYRPNNDAIKSFALHLRNDYDNLAKFIVELSKYATSKDLYLNCNIFIDSNNNIIEGRTYINGGSKVESIPSFLKFNYINEQLESALKAKMILKSGHPEQERDMASKLNCVGDISSSDITYIIRNILPKKSDSLRHEREQKELLTCLFNIFRSRHEDFSIGDAKVYLPTENENEWACTDTLVMSDKRFPNGFANLNLEFKYDKKRCVLFPDFLLREQATESDIQNFFIALGVSLYVCKKHEQFSLEYLQTLNLPTDVLNNCRWKDRDHKNWTDIADMSILSELSLNSIITLLSDYESDYYSEVCGGQLIHWFINSYKTPVKVPISFAAFLLRTKTQAKDLKYYAVEDDEWLPGMKPKSIRPFGSDYRTKQLLEALGAKKYLSDFTPIELYEAVINKTEEYRLTHQSFGIQTFYHKIKQALDKNGEPQIPSSLQMLCTIGENICIRESREIFYSDNNSLSEEIVKRLPLLMMNSREGELLVNKCFGCKSFKDVLTQFTTQPTENTVVTNELQEKMNNLNPYFLAVVSEDIGIKGGMLSLNNSAKKTLSDLRIRVVISGKYSCNVASTSLGEYELNDGNLIYINDMPVICTKQYSLSKALEDPKFCNAIVEAICISLRLSVKENIDRFYRLIRSTPSELDYIHKYDISPELWQSCQEAFGISDIEIDFWKNVFTANGKREAFDPEKIKEEKSAYIVKCLGIPFDRANSNNFEIFHIQKLQRVRNEYVDKYKIWLHDILKNNLADQRQYLSKINDFQDDDWIKVAFHHWGDKYAILPDYRNFIIRQMSKRFDFDSEKLNLADTSVPVKYEKYNYDGIELNIEDESLLYFDGNEEYFANLIKKYDCDNTFDETDNHPDNKIIENVPQILIVETESTPESRSFRMNNGNKRGRRQTRRKLSDSELKRIGNEAEDKVLKALQSPDSEYEVGTIFSMHLNPESGNDAQGYDLEYKLKGDSIFRCLEIKHFTGDSIIVSRHEYEVAQSKAYRNRYDVALVSGNEIQIWRNAFSDESKYTKFSEDYIITFKVNPIDSSC